MNASNGYGGKNWCVWICTVVGSEEKGWELGIALGKDPFNDCGGRDGEHCSASVYLHVVSAL